MNRPKFILILVSAISLIAIVALAAPGTANHGPPHGNVGSDFKQCENDDNAPHACVWSGSILQQNNAVYSEGMSVPQQLILNGLTGTSHSFSFKSQASKGGVHAYDYITSFSQAVAVADALHPGEDLMANVELCNGLNGATLTRCDALRVSSNTVDVTAPDNMGLLEGHNVAAAITNYETLFGNRFVEIYGTSGSSAITGTTLVFTGYTGSGDKEANYVLNWTSNSPDIMIRWAGHLAIGAHATLGYGPGLGSSDISGGPYHWGLSGLDTGSLGNQANQIQGSDVLAVPASGAIEIFKDAVPNAAQDFGFTSPGLSPAFFVLDDDVDATLGNTILFSSVATGIYVITENVTSGWDLSAIDCAAIGAGTSFTVDLELRKVTIVMGIAGAVTCTFTNDGSGTLTVIKDVVTDSGGTADPEDFLLYVKADGVDVTGSPQPGDAEGTVYTLLAGEYQVSEDGLLGYEASFSGDCDADGLVTIAPGDDLTCTITNNDQAASLTVIKHVVNNDGGTRVASDWTMLVNATDPSAASFAGSESPGTTITLDAGLYSVSETGPTGYAMSLSAGCSGTIALNESKTCTITNDDIAPTLLVKKHVINDNGGAEVAGNWTITVTGTDVSPAVFAGSESSIIVTLDAGSYSVDESIVPGGYSKTLGAECSGSLAPGEAKTCTITNDDIKPQLTVIKTVVNQDGGAQLASNWTMLVTGTNVSSSSFPGSAGTLITLDAGNYSVNESATPLGYARSFSQDCSGTLLPGDNKTCTVTNDDIRPRLTVIKHVENNDGGANASSEWTMTVTGGAPNPASFPGSEAGILVSLAANALYDVGESGGPSGYSASFSADCSGILQPGEEKTCTVTNDDIRPILKVIKHVVNDHGGLNVSSEWTMVVTGGDASPALFAGSEAGILVSLAANAPYIVGESGPGGYAATFDGACQGTLQPGENKTCTVTNDDIKPILTVIKHVVNDDGGLNVSAEWTLSVSGGAIPASFPGDEQGTLVSIDANTLYAVTESGPSGYAMSLSADCSGALQPGEEKTCTVTNNDTRPTLTVIKHVVNNDGGTNVSSDWTMIVTGAEASPGWFPGDEEGTIVSLLANSAYSVSESSTPMGYNATFEGDCEGILLPGQSATCTATNDDIRPKLVVVKHVVNDDGGLQVASDWTFTVEGGGAAPSSFQGSELGVNVSLAAGAMFWVNETGPSGYVASTHGQCDGMLLPGQVAVCVFVNNDTRPQLTVIKHVVTDNGGQHVAGDWTMGVNGTGVSQPSFAGTEAGTLVSLAANAAYSVNESGPAGYLATYSADCAGSLLPGDNKTCTVTNDDIQPRLTVIKHVVNDDGGLNVSAQWTMSVSGTNASPASFPGSELGTLVTLDAGSYSVDESSLPAGYAKSLSADCSGTLLPGDDKTCTVTNDDIAPNLWVIKHVMNDHGGLNVSAQWTMTVTGTNVSDPSFAGSEAPGIMVTIDANSLYSVGESGPAGYAMSLGSDCSGILQPGDNKTCIVTNDDIEPTLFVIKHTVNNDGGLNVSSQWTMTVTGADPAPSSFAGSEAGVIVSLNANSLYAVSESGPSGYEMGLSPDCSGSLQPGESKTCTVTNDDTKPILWVIKHVVNDDGGLNVSSEWTMTVSGASVFPGNFPGSEAPGTMVTLDANSLYSVAESGPDGYSISLSADCSGILQPGANKTCIVTNDDIEPTLFVIKHTVNNDGGLNVSSQWTMTVTGADPAPAAFPGSEVGTLVSLDANSLYSVSESGPSGYAMSLSADCSGSLQPGESKTCTVTNDDIKPILRVIKHTVNDDGGQNVSAEWTMTVSGPNVIPSSFPGNEAGILVSLDANSLYDVSESGPSGYAMSTSAACSGILQPGDNKTCTVTNDDIAPTLLVIKHTVNDHGGLNVSSQWTMTVTGGGPSPSSFAGSEAGVLVSLDANSLYSVTESGPAGYAMTLSADCTGSLQPGEQKTCTITNDDIVPKLTVIKHVVNDNGGDQVADNWTMTVTGVSVSLPSFPGDESGTLVTLHANALYNVSEAGPSGYAPSLSGDCSGVLLPGDDKTCMITNDDIAPKLLVKKHVINDEGGALLAANWTLTVSGSNVSLPSFAGSEAGVLITLDANSPYAVDESGPAGYAMSLSSDCSGSLLPGETKNCTITNDDIAPKLTVIKHVINDHGGDEVAGNWTLTVTGLGVSLPSFNGSEAGTLVTLFAGAPYSVDESGPAGYAANFSAACAGTLLPGADVICTVTNDDIVPKLTVIKHVVNDHNGPEVAANWTMTVAGVSVSMQSFPGDESGTLVTLHANSLYNVSEAGPIGYAADFSEDCGGILQPGEEKTCTVTNDDIQPKILVKKIVVNDHGGLLDASAFTLSVTGTDVSPWSFSGDSSGVLVGLDQGSYNVSEIAAFGYNMTRSADCSGTILVGETKNCTITNDDIQPRLIVIKHVVNDDQGADSAADFTMSVTGTNVSSSSFAGAESPGTLVLLDAGTYSVSESGPSGYAQSFSSDCSGSIAVGETKTCTVTNNDIGPTRTQGFWGQHTGFTIRIFDDYLGGAMTIGSGPDAKIIDTEGELFGAFLSDIKKESDRLKRDPIEQARMQLVQQLAAARLNCAAFGCEAATLAMLADADDAYVGSDVELILTYVGLVDEYNNSKDSVPITSSLGSWGKATPKASRDLADIPFWDETIS